MRNHGLFYEIYDIPLTFSLFLEGNLILSKLTDFLGYPTFPSTKPDNKNLTYLALKIDFHCITIENMTSFENWLFL